MLVLLPTVDFPLVPFVWVFSDVSMNEYVLGWFLFGNLLWFSKLTPIVGV